MARLNGAFSRCFSDSNRRLDTRHIYLHIALIISPGEASQLRGLVRILQSRDTKGTLEMVDGTSELLRGKDAPPIRKRPIIRNYHVQNASAQQLSRKTLVC
jgi:hypothetical protein